MVSNDIFVSFLHCKRKSFQRAAETPGRPADIETVMFDLDQGFRRRALEAFLAPYGARDILDDPPSLEVALKSRPQVIVNVTASADGMSSLIHAVDRVTGVNQHDAPVYIPILFVLNETISRADKLLLAFNALALSSVQGVLPVPLSV